MKPISTKVATETKQNTNTLNQALQIALLILGRMLVVVLNILLLLPIVLLPLTTAVPAGVWIFLGMASIALIVLQFRVKPAARGAIVGLTGMLLVGVLAIVASQFFAATPPITDAGGKPIPGSIASLEQINLNGSEQWITLRGRDTTKPVLLHLGMGGPGGGGFGTRSMFTPLEQDFVVVSWDEPGTGKSMNAVPYSQLTTERFIDDAHALTLYLRERFHQDKIYIYGVSWTSILGVWLAQRYPDLYYAYIGNGQMVNTTQNDVMGYELALDYLAKQGDNAARETLRRNGPPPYRGDDLVSKYLAYIDVLNDYMHSPRFAIVVPIVPFLAPEYGYVDKVNHTLALIESFRVVYPQLQDLDFITQAQKLDVPVYLFAGRNDVNAMSSLVQDYYNVLQAPRKELIWLKGGHGLDGSNLPQFTDVMLHKVLAETYPNK